MSTEKRLGNTRKRDMGAGLYLARVISHLDPAFMGGLQVTLLRRDGNIIGDVNQTYSVMFASPFYGSTAYEFMGKNKTDFNDTQKSYGMWFVPPDVGVTVLVAFVDGDPSQGYFIACIPGRFTNNMIPAIAASTDVELSDSDKTKFDTKQPLPVGEINRAANTLDKNMAVDKIKKPVHPIADRFLEQGLLEDDVRGATTSSSRRSVPNMVFGISTPGPLDRRPGALKKSIGTKQSQSPAPVPVSRLGGTQLVFDDGDDQYQRKKPAGEGPREYADTLNKEKGDPTVPFNEYFRIRTRTGHQLLFHNTEDLIYIANSRGTAWIELTSNGKIDIYAKDSVSIHSENDLNIRADRDINFEAGRNINMRAASGRLQADIATDFLITAGKDGKLTIGAEYEHVVGANTKITSAGNFDINSGGNFKNTASGTMDIKAGGRYKETASRIDMNGPTASSSDKAKAIEPLSLHEVPVSDITVGWGEKKRYQSEQKLKTLMWRVPMHEPWQLHESNAPEFLQPDKTDRDVD